MTLIILLFSLGVVLIAVEVIVPGGILGTLGGLMMFGGCVVAFVEYGTPGGILALAVALVLIVSALFIQFRLLPKTRIGRRAFLTSQITGVSTRFGSEAQELVGKAAEAITMLSPSGYILVDGKRYEAFSQIGQIPAGTHLKVIAADNFRLIVTPTNTN
jgi:membrane-bound ClpP family serine protease